MKLKLDENLGKQGSLLLRAEGHDVATVVGEMLAGAPDRLLLETCHEEGRALITLDREFADPVRFDPKAYSGIVLLRLPRRPAPSDLDDAIQTLALALRSRSLVGELWIVERGVVREYGTDR
jgi:hypothetical protein